MLVLVKVRSNILVSSVPNDGALFLAILVAAISVRCTGFGVLCLRTSIDWKTSAPYIADAMSLQ